MQSLWRMLLGRRSHSSMLLYFYICPLLCLYFISFLVDFSILRVASIYQSSSFYDFICCQCHPAPLSCLLVPLLRALVLGRCRRRFLFGRCLDFNARFDQTKKRKRSRGVASVVGENGASTKCYMQRAALHCLVANVILHSHQSDSINTTILHFCIYSTRRQFVMVSVC